MGVAGCGKSTVAARLARALRARLIESDDYHPTGKARTRCGAASPWTIATGRHGSTTLGSLLADRLGPHGAHLFRAEAQLSRSPARRRAPSLKIVYLEISHDESKRARRGATRPTCFRPAWWTTSFRCSSRPSESPAFCGPTPRSRSRHSAKPCCAGSAKPSFTALETLLQSVLKNFDLTGRTALITGSSAGIGFALARGLAGAGARVVLNARNADKLEQAAGTPARRRRHGLHRRLRRDRRARP